MAKPATALVGFAKTRLLEPGESETLMIAFAPYAFAAYDDEGVIQKSAYVLEKGQNRFTGSMTELAANEEVRRAYLSV